MGRISPPLLHFLCFSSFFWPAMCLLAGAPMANFGSGGDFEDSNQDLGQWHRKTDTRVPDDTMGSLYQP